MSPAAHAVRRRRGPGRPAGVAAGSRKAALLEAARTAIAREGGVEERLRSVVGATAGVHGEDRFAPRLMVEQVLFGEVEVIDEFVEGYASRNLALIGGLLDADVGEGRLRPFGQRFLAAPVLQRLFGIGELDPELVERFADHTVEVLLHGITRPEESTA